ncbi:hypothetical protein RYX36_031159 [Vicia faba]
MKKTLWFRQTLTIRAAVTGIATVAAAGIIFVLKDTRSSKPFTSLVKYNNASEKPLLIPGLQNLGNNCFLNVVLQALASCVCFQSFLDSVIAEYENDDENMPLRTVLRECRAELS